MWSKGYHCDQPVGAGQRFIQHKSSLMWKQCFKQSDFLGEFASAVSSAFLFFNWPLQFLTRVIRFCVGPSPTRVSPGRVRRGGKKTSCWPQFQRKRALNLRSEAAFWSCSTNVFICPSPAAFFQLFWISASSQPTDLVLVCLSKADDKIGGGRFKRSLFMTGQWPKEAGGLTVRRARACFCASYWQSSDADD